VEGKLIWACEIDAFHNLLLCIDFFLIIHAGQTATNHVLPEAGEKSPSPPLNKGGLGGFESYFLRNYHGALVPRQSGKANLLFAVTLCAPLLCAL
jgi:hypothetical protein